MEIYKRIESFLDKAKENTNNYSLYQGYTGLCYSYFILSSVHNKDRNQKIAEDIYMDICNNLGRINDASFSNGLAGVGWAIEAINNNGFTNINTDKFLRDFDDFLYKFITFQKTQNLSLDSGCLGKALYFYQRLTSQNKTNDPYRYIAHAECLTLLTDEIRTFLNLLVNKDTKDINKDECIEISQSFILLYLIWKLRYNTELLSKMLPEIRTFIEKYFEENKTESYSIYLLYSYALIAFKANDNEMINNTKKWVHNFSSLNNESNLMKYLYFKVNRMTGTRIELNIPIESLTDTFFLLDEHAENLKIPALRIFCLD